MKEIVETKCPLCEGRGMGAYLTDDSGLDDFCPKCGGTGFVRLKSLKELGWFPPTEDENRER